MLHVRMTAQVHAILAKNKGYSNDVLKVKLNLHIEELITSDQVT